MASSVQYIAESATTLDGNLADSIDQHTHTDRYENILEVDANGDLIGGERWNSPSRPSPPRCSSQRGKQG
jgi:hypothetical protein